MAKIAVDIVLLPSQEIAERAVEANKLLRQKYLDRIFLDVALRPGSEATLPHISLAMGCIDTSCINVLQERLGEIADKYPPGFLYLTEISNTTNTNGEYLSYFIIKKTPALLKLHQEVIRQFDKYFSYNVTANMLLSEKSIPDSTLDWIRNYRQKSSFENFSPHITLGYGRIAKSSTFYQEFPSLPHKFTASQLAICHLSSHCTCKKIMVNLII